MANRWKTVGVMPTFSRYNSMSAVCNNSRDYFHTTYKHLSAGCPKSADRLFRDHTDEKDFWSKWFGLLEKKKWVDDQGGAEMIVGTPNRGPYSNVQLELMSEDWATLCMTLLQRARKKWGSSVFRPGEMVRALSWDELDYHLADVEDFPGESQTMSRDIPLIAWREEKLDRLNKYMQSGALPDGNDYGRAMHPQEKMMIVSDHLIFVECKKSWQVSSPSPYIQFIPDFWYYRVIQLLATLNDRPTTMYVFADPEWGMGHMLHNGYFSLDIDVEVE